MFVNQVYPDGSIKKIEYQNFLTYGSATCVPGPNLNVIIGSNGSGKSTIICGICIAVGGSPKILGRSERITDYVKHNCNEGFVELTIADSKIQGDEIRIRAVISKQNPNLQYFLNGRKTTITNVREIVHDYNIQIENPCTFLAQDKVKSFSEQNSLELLMNTEKAGSKKLFDLHNKIIDKKKEEQNLENKMKGLESKLQAIENELTIIEPKVNSYLKRQKLQSRMMLLKKKKAIMVFDEKNSRYHDASENLRILEKALVNEEKKFEKMTMEHRDGVEKSNDLRDEMEKLLDKIAITKEVMRKNTNPDFYLSGVEQARNELRRIRQNAQQWQEKLNRKKTELDLAKAQMEEKKQDYCGYEDAQKEYIRKRDEITMQIERIEFELETKDNERRNVESQKTELSRSKLQNEQMRGDRLNHLNTTASGGRAAANAYLYYLKHKTEFQGPIFMPAVHAVVPNPNRIHQVMNAVGNREWPMLIFSCKQDEQHMHSKVKGINSTVISKEQIERNRARLDAKMPLALRQMGFEGLLSEFITAPDAVKLHFMQANGIDCVLIGGNAVDENFDEIGEKLKNTPFGVFITNKNRIDISTSRYTGNVIKERKDLRMNGSALTLIHTRDYIIVPTDRIQKLDILQAEITQKRNEFEKEQKEIEKKRAQIKDVFSDWEKKKRVYQNALGQFKMKETEYETHEANVIDVGVAEKAYEKQREKYMQMTLKMARAAVDAAESLRVLTVRREVAHKMVLELVESVQEAKQKMEALQAAVRNMKIDIRVQEEDIAKEKAEVEAARQDLSTCCGITTTDKRNLSPQHLEIFREIEQIFNEENIPNELDELDRQIADEEVRLQMASANSEGSARDVRRRDELKVEKAELISDRIREKEERANYEEDLGKMVDEWLAPLLELVQKISVNFTRFFNEMACTGEVKLFIPDHKLDVNKYGIDILVRFRETEKLRRLDNQSQSGGERSVSTMLYLLALQELCPVPFRCVDEINQGMDPTNERKVFEIMVNTLSNNGNLAKTQYFLLTPKLLHGLKYNEKVTVQIVHNSPTLGEDSKDWDHCTFLKMLSAK